MKKNFLLFINITFLFIFTACTGNGTTFSDKSIMMDTTDTSETSQEKSSVYIDTEKDETLFEDTTDIATSEILVAYFSATGNTENIANHIVNITGADTFKIETTIPYTAEDIDYTIDNCRANQEQNDKTFRPEISGNIENMQDYDIIFLGYPIWWGEEPRIIDTFLESYDFSNKTVIPFCTSGSSDIATSEKNIANLDIIIGNQIKGRRFSGNASEQNVLEWINTLELP